MSTHACNTSTELQRLVLFQCPLRDIMGIGGMIVRMIRTLRCIHVLRYLCSHTSNCATAREGRNDQNNLGQGQRRAITAMLRSGLEQDCLHDDMTLDSQRHAITCTMSDSCLQTKQTQRQPRTQLCVCTHGQALRAHGRATSAPSLRRRGERRGLARRLGVGG